MSYTPTVWSTGDIITADKLNHAETGIVEAEGQSSKTADEVDKLKSALNNLEEFCEKEVKTTTNGNLTVTAGTSIAASTHLIDVNISNGDNFDFVLNANQNVSSYHLYMNGSPFKYNCVPETVYHITAETNIAWISIYCAGASVTGSGTVTGVVTTFKETEDSLEERIECIGRLNTSLLTSTWEQGTISSSGAIGPSDYAIRCAPIDVQYFSSLDISITSGYKFGYHFYDKNMVHISSASAWQSKRIPDLSVPANAKYLRINITASSGTVPYDLDWADELTCIGTQTIVHVVNELAKTEIGTGNSFYYGEKVSLDYEEATKKCNISLWKDFLGEEIQDITDYSLHLNQSMTIYGGYVFCFSANGICTILDYSTKTIVGKCSFTPNTNQHANSAQFTNIFYIDGDEFPLLIMSRCGNTYSFIGTLYDACLIYRITRSGTTFTMTLVNQIVPTFNTYGSSYGVDNYSNKLIISAYLNGTWQAETNNPIVIMSFDMPTKSDILGDDEITLNIGDANTTMQTDHYTFQGLTVNGGLVYEGITYNGQNVWVFNPCAGKIQTKIPLLSSLEVEGVSVYEKKLYVSQKNGSDTSGTNPMQIYEITFS